MPANFRFDNTPYSSYGCVRIIGTFPNGVDSLCAVPLGWWTRWLSQEEGKKALAILNDLEARGKIDWSGQFPEIKTGI